MGGVAFVYNLSKSTIVHSDVKETALFTIGTLAGANGRCVCVLERDIQKPNSGRPFVKDAVQEIVSFAALEASDECTHRPQMGQSSLKEMEKIYVGGVCLFVQLKIYWSTGRKWPL